MKTYRCWSIIAAILLALASATSAVAGFVPGSVDVGFTPPGPPPWAGSGGPPPFVFEIVPDNSALANMKIEEEVSGLDPLNLRISGRTTDDPTITITKEVTNNTAFTWIGYEIGVDGGSNAFVAGSASSNVMTLASETANLLTFGLPSPVQSGETVSFSFQINIPTTGGFQFDLTQQAVPVPEPASLILLALSAGFIGLGRRRR